MEIQSRLDKVFVIFDDKSKSYGSPITAANKGVFLRDILGRILESGGPIAKHPMDFSVFEIGEYDPDSGLMLPSPNKSCLGLVSDFKQ